MVVQGVDGLRATKYPCWIARQFARLRIGCSLPVILIGHVAALENPQQAASNLDRRPRPENHGDLQSQQRARASHLII